MDRYQFVLLSAAFLATTSCVAFAEETLAHQEPSSIAAFQLTDASGKVWKVAPRADKQFTVVCFLGTECPLARYYGPRLSKLAQEYAGRPVQFIGVNSNSQDSQQDVNNYCKEFQISFPICKDPANQLADQFGARHMVELFVLDPALPVRSHGRVDDQYLPGIARTQPGRHDLQVALDELLSGKPVSVARTETTGCAIGRVRKPEPDARYDFCQHVSRILNQHCVECHRPGEIGPFSLTDYNEVTGWGTTILETIDSGRMPPWNANPKHGEFLNARIMPEADKEVLREWVRSGMPYGDQANLPPQPEFASGWQMGRAPDLVLKMRDRPFRVPASGTVEYQYFVVDPHFEEDRWVSASQVIPGNPATVHHCIVFVRPPDGTEVRGVGYLSGYVPGQRSFLLPPGHARRVPAGSKFVFQMHYTPNGVPQDDLTQIGMLFVPESAVTHESFTLLGIDQEFEIPPRNADFAVQADLGWVPKRAELLAIIPHMHLRGKAFQATSRVGDQREILLDLPRYDFNWQHVYALSKPLPLKEIDQLSFTAHFDNSDQNPANPDPSQTVTWGDQTWEEMAVAFFEVSEPRSGDPEPEPQRNKQKLIIKTPDEKSQTETAEAFADQFMTRFDKNRDGVVEPLETPLSFRRFGFHQYDSNNDGKLNRDEVRNAAKHRARR